MGLNKIKVKNGKPHGYGKVLFWTNQTTQDYFMNYGQTPEDHYTNNKDTNVYCYTKTYIKYIKYVS